MTLPAPPAWYATLCAAARLDPNDWTPAGLDHLNWALSYAAAPCPPLSASGQLEHSRATAVVRPWFLPLPHASAMKERG